VNGCGNVPKDESKACSFVGVKYMKFEMDNSSNVGGKATAVIRVVRGVVGVLLGRGWETGILGYWDSSSSSSGNSNSIITIVGFFSTLHPWPALAAVSPSGWSS